MVEVHIPRTSKVIIHEVIIKPNNNQEQQINDQTLHNENVNNETTILEP